MFKDFHLNTLNSNVIEEKSSVSPGEEQSEERDEGESHMVNHKSI